MLRADEVPSDSEAEDGADLILPVECQQQLSQLPSGSAAEECGQPQITLPWESGIFKDISNSG